MMLAADELSPASDNDLVATGFLARNFFRWNYDSWKKDNVEHVGKAFLGLTVNCAHCHDHKYDPITHEDYFRFAPSLSPSSFDTIALPGEPDPGAYPKYEYGKAYPPMTSGMVRVIDEKLDAKTYLYTRGEARNVVPNKPPIAPGVPVFLDNGSFRIESVDLPPEAYYPGLKSFVQQEEIAARETALGAAEQSATTARHDLEVASQVDAEAARLALAIEQAKLIHAQSELAAINARVIADLVRFGKKDGDLRLIRAGRGEGRARGGRVEGDNRSRPSGASCLRSETKSRGRSECSSRSDEGGATTRRVASGLGVGTGSDRRRFERLCATRPKLSNSEHRSPGSTRAVDHGPR